MSSASAFQAPLVLSFRRLSTSLRRPAPRPSPHRPSRPFLRRPTSTLSSLPSASTVSSATFPHTVTLAAQILSPSPLPAANLALLSSLLATPAGVRGLFVALLSTPDITLADAPSDALVGVLRARAADRDFSDILVKNVVMSAAMGVFYRRDGEEQLAEASEMTARRARRCLAALRGEGVVDAVVEEMSEGLEGRGAYVAFLKKWGYDAEQKTRIKEVLVGDED